MTRDIAEPHDSTETDGPFLISVHTGGEELHFGPFRSRQALTRAAGRLRRARPDAVYVIEDLHPAERIPGFAEVLAETPDSTPS